MGDDESVPVAVGIAAASLLGASPALHAYRVPGSFAVVAGAAILSTVLSFVASRWWRQSSAAAYGISVIGLVIFLVAEAGPNPAALVRELVRGPNRIITETLPLGGGRSIITTLVVLTWVCGAATSELLIRSGGDRRDRSNAGLAVPVVFYILSYAASASVGGRDRISGPLLLAVIAAVALIRYHYASAATLVAIAESDANARPPRYRAVAVGALAAVSVTAVLSFAVPALPGMARPAASLHRAAPTAATVLVDPVDAMAELRDGTPHSPARTVMTVQSKQGSSGYMAMAVLSDYDGAVWRFQTTFEPTGGRIPAPPQSGPAPISDPSVDQRVTIDGPLPIPLLPVLDRPSLVQGLSVVVDPVTGMVLPAAAAPPLTYTVTSRSPGSTLASVPPADGIAPAASVTQADLELPPNSVTDVATTLRYLSDLTHDRPAASVAFLQSVVAALDANDSRIDPSLPVPKIPPPPKAKGSTSRHPSSTTTTIPLSAASVGGTSLSDVINAVTVNRSATPEQFATFFAMVARYLGVPARVATGFRLAPSSTSGQIGPGKYSVTTAQAWTWVEIPIAGLGWVVVDPTPNTVAAVSAPPLQQVQAPPTTLPPRQANAVPQNAIIGGHALAHPTPVKIPRHHSLAAWIVALLAAGVLVALILVIGPGQAAARRAWRRNSRHSQLAAELSVGAWLELIDGLDQAGMVTAAGSTSTEVAGEAELHFGPDLAASVRTVGSLADRAMFSTSEEVDLPSAQRSWEMQRSTRRMALQTLDRRQRLSAWLSVGSSPRRPGG